MARKALVEDDVLLGRLSATFRNLGYEAASMALLADAAGLKKASLYHRFPGGKEELGREVLLDAGRWLTINILEPLAGHAPPATKIGDMVAKLDQFYDGGAQACLLNLMASPVSGEGPFKSAIQGLFEAFIAALTSVVAQAGYSGKVARDRAERAVALLHGSLVLSRGLGSTAPFQKMLKALPGELLGGNQT